MNDELNIKNIRLISIVCILSALLIDIIYNLKIDSYLKSFIIPLTIMLTDYIFLIPNNKLDKNKKAYIILIPIGLILLSNIIINVDYSNKFLNVFILPLLMSTFFFYLTNKNYYIGKNIIQWAFKLFPSGLFSNLKYTKETFKKAKYKTILNIFVGLLIGIPIALLILSLLTSADRYFGEFINNILTVIPTLSFNQIYDVLIFIVSFILLFSIFINISKNKNLKMEDKSPDKKINIEISSTILIIVNIIFLIFIISEVSKLTINFLHLPLEYTYAEYAREGFFQLLIVTAINFCMIIYHIYYTKGIDEMKFIKKMLLVLSIFSIILILNSYYRMFLYVGAYEFTILRLQVLLFLTMELILFIMLIRKIIGKFKYKENILYPIILIVFYILNIYLCTNSFVEFINKTLI